MSGHATARALLRLANLPALDAKATRLGCDKRTSGRKLKGGYPADFNLKMANLLLADQPGWTLPACPKCLPLVLEALSKRTLPAVPKKEEATP